MKGTGVIDPFASTPEAGLSVRFALDVPGLDLPSVLDRVETSIGKAFADIAATAQCRMLGFVEKEGDALFRLAVKVRSDGSTLLQIEAPESLATPFDLALVSCVFIEAVWGQGSEVTTEQDVGPLEAAPAFTESTFGCLDEDVSRAERFVAAGDDPARVAEAISTATGIWTGQETATLCLVEGHASLRVRPQYLSEGRKTPLGHGTWNSADFMCCIERSGAREETAHLFRALLSGRDVIVDVCGQRVQVLGLPVHRREAALTVYALRTKRGYVLQAVSGRRGLSQELAELFLNDVAMIFSVGTPADRGTLPSVAARRKRCAEHRAAGESSLSARHLQWNLFEAFEETCSRFGNRTALRDDVETLTYSALRQRARALGAVLQACDFHGAPVGLLCNHGAMMVIGMLGALAAARTYVPLDPDYPEKRLAYILQSSGADRLLYDGANCDLAQRIAPAGCAIACINDKHSDAEPLQSRSLPNKPAYILYTSGSTGTPKRVVQSHRNVIVQIRNHIATLGIGETDIVSVVSSFCFDASVTDTYGALLTGATLVPVSARRYGLDHVADIVRREGVSVWHSTPTAFRRLTEALPGPGALPQMRCVVLGGEPVFARDVQAAAQHCAPNCLLVNGYGATEASFIAQNPVSAKDYAGPDVVPIGWPIPGFDVDLVDQDGRPAPVFGELQVQTAHFASDGSRTAPAAPETHLTGDLARFDPKTGLSYFGRCGTQMKVRGYRVDLAEIEQVLRRQQGVIDACVAIRPDPRDPKTEVLSAYLAIAESAPRKAPLARAVQAELPSFMVPTYYTFLPRLPQTESGKIDRKAMPEPDTMPDPAEPGSRGQPPSLVHKVLRSTFGLERYDPQASFFDLGLTSLSIAALHERLVRETSCPLSLIDLFELGTPAKLAAKLADANTTADADPLSDIQARLRQRKKNRKSM